MILTVKDVDYLGDYTLLCTFNGKRLRVYTLHNSKKAVTAD